MKYHVNPKTGMAGACFAKEGNCPYGDYENHYETYEEAQAASFDFMEDHFSLINDDLDDLPESEEQNYDEIYHDLGLNDDEIEEDEYDYLNSLSDDELMEEIVFTKDKNLLNGILSRQVLLENDDEKFIYKAAQNEYISKDWFTSVAKSPDDYTKSFVSAIIKNPAIEDDELFDLAMNTKSQELKEKALSSPNIPESSIILNVGVYGEKAKNNLTYLFYKNPNCPLTAKKALHKKYLNGRYGG